MELLKMRVCSLYVLYLYKRARLYYVGLMHVRL